MIALTTIPTEAGIPPRACASLRDLVGYFSTVNRPSVPGSKAEYVGTHLMGSGHNFQKFVTAILELSGSQEWLEAKTEWTLHAVYDDPRDDRTCECGHRPINQICIIKNIDNGNRAEVGNVCVHNFMRLASRRIFAVLNRIRGERSKSLNPASLDLFVKRGALSNIEADEYKSYWRKRTSLTDEERAQKLDINERVLRFTDDESVKLAANFVANGLKPRQQ